ncbi:Uncharacterised protein [Candidatus Gugararchaeum adminiculabundum]|nr:Uncharacterised protein [Candidatus Gugararchaeum adminiculabundum]
MVFVAIAVLFLAGKIPPRELLIELRVIRSSLGCLVQAFDPDSISSGLQLQVSLENAKKAFELGENVSDSLENEFLLHAAGTRKFDLAISRVGVKDTSKFLLFCDDEAKLKSIAQKLGASVRKFSPTLTAAQAQKIYGIEKEIFQTLSLEQAVIEKIALFSD